MCPLSQRGWPLHSASRYALWGQDQYTALMLAAKFGDAARVEALVACKADLEARSTVRGVLVMFFAMWHVFWPINVGM